MHISCLFTSRRQRAVRCPYSLLPTICLCALYCSHFALHDLGLPKSLRLYIRPQMPFADQNHASNHPLGIFAYTADSKCWVFDSSMTTIFIPQRIARTRCFNRWRCDIRYVRNICERAKCCDSWLSSQIMLLVRAWLGSQTLAVVGEKMRFQTLFN